MQQERKEISGKANTIAGFSIPLYLGILALVVVCMYMDCLPVGLVGGMIALMVLGEGLNFLGNHTPVVKTYLGGSVICILGAAVIQALVRPGSSSIRKRSTPAESGPRSR